MTLTELRYIVALAQTKHFGKAANACLVSQPTLSVAISKLEAKLGISIFERHPNEIKITPIGDKIISQAQCVIAEANVINEIAKKGKTHCNEPLRIGGIYTLAPYLFPQLIPSLRKAAPDMPQIIHEDFTGNLRTKLQNGDLDVIFISLPFTGQDIVCKTLYDEPFVVLMRKDHPLKNNKTVSGDDLAHENILLLDEGHCFRDQIIEACPQCFKNNGIQQTIKGGSLETLRQLVAAGDGVTILPSSATQIKHYQSILTVKPFTSKTPKRTIALAWRTSFTRTKTIDVLIEALSVCKLNGICLMPDVI